jgi:hypothetical protein
MSIGDAGLGATGDVMYGLLTEPCIAMGGGYDIPGTAPSGGYAFGERPKEPGKGLAARFDTGPLRAIVGGKARVLDGEAPSRAYGIGPMGFAGGACIVGGGNSCR